MATYKNTTQGLVDAYIGFFDDQVKMAAYYDQKAKEFGFTAAEVLAKRFERTYLNGFTSPASPAKHFWKNVSPGTYETPSWRPRASVLRGATGKGLAVELSSIRNRWAKMLKECPVGKDGELDFSSVLQLMGFNNWLSFFGVGGVSMFIAADRTAMFLSIRYPPESWDPAKFGWQEILGSEYNVEKARLSLKRAEEEARRAQEAPA